MSFYAWLEAAYRNKKNCPYWGDSGAGVLPFCKSTNRFLLNKRSASVNEGNSYGIFGGGIFLDDTHYKTIEELAKTTYPKEHALEELREETGYSGTIELSLLYTFKDNKINSNNEPCNFYYWNFLGICMAEFPVNPGFNHKWEVEDSPWMTFEEMMSVQPKHFGLIELLKHSSKKLMNLSHYNN